ncbi:AfsR/SARP family transcriptional regulator [Streptomyces acidiscabies]|uniref:AfsR/SARP family transcriptional regulator n=1 Tax=Streptomyces acidiscabies TaxID=42234 RepID=UPI000A5BE7D5|nr:BTAD domain-containing putative transcriptional regulator [Streptomyces acidiscabies]
MAYGKPADVRFNILGSLEGWHGDRRLKLGSPTQERVLVTLLLEPDRMVPVSRLVAAAWDDEPPQTASHQVRKAVAALRTRIPGGADLILTDGTGYRAVLADDQLDLHEFNHRTRRAREASAAGQLTEAIEELRAAVDLWRGPVLAGAGGSLLAAASAALEERHMAVAEQYHELRLELGEAGELVGSLRELIASHPLREALRGQLMLALYRSGRQAEALEEFARVRELLVEELGIDPGAELTRLYEAILRDSPEVAPRSPTVRRALNGTAAAGSTASGAASEPSAAGAVAVGPAPDAKPAEAPRTLPYDLPDFTGRQAELERIVTAGRTPGRGAARLVGVDGMGGSGKTALAVHTAHRLAEEYPDGQLFVDLRGFSPGEKPQEAGPVVDSLLRSLGVPDDRMPEGIERRLALWQQLSAKRRLLLVLDNAVDAAQIRPLLPASEGCLVLLTSRMRMLDLDGAEWLSLELLSPADSTALLERTLGADRAAAEAEAAEQLVKLCGGLPLALRITAARLRNRPRWTLQYLVDRLADETRRLYELSTGERSVEATLRLSYQAMEEPRRAAFRLLAEHPGSTLDVHSVAALLDGCVRTAEDILEHLLDIHLLDQPEMGLYSFHDLVRTYALGLRGDEDDSAGALRRLVSYYVAATEAACDALFPGRTRYEADTDQPAWRVPEFVTAEQALGWFRREHDALRAVVERAGVAGLHRDTVVLSRNLMFCLNLLGRHEEFGAAARGAVASARVLGDPLLLRVSLGNLGIAHWWLGAFQDGIEAAGEALGLEGGDRATEAFCLDVLGLLHSALGNFERARAYLEQGIALHRELGSARMEAEALANLSSVLTWSGRYAQAAVLAARATELNRRLGERGNEITSLTWLALAHLGLGESERGRVCLAQALELCDESLQPGNVALVHAHWALLCQRRGQEREAREFADQALELVSSRGTSLRRAAVANAVGVVRRLQGEPERALELHRRAHQLASTLGYRIETARAAAGMGEVMAALGDLGAAAEQRAAAGELFDAMGVLEVGRGM